MKNLGWLLIIGILFSCGQKVWTKRGYKHGWIKSEITYDTIITGADSRDTIFKNTVIRDTVILKENKLTVKYFYNTKDSTVYLSGKCDPDTIRVEKEIIKIETKEGIYWKRYMIAFLLLLLILLLVVSRLRR